MTWNSRITILFGVKKKYISASNQHCKLNHLEISCNSMTATRMSNFDPVNMQIRFLRFTKHSLSKPNFRFQKENHQQKAFHAKTFHEKKQYIFFYSLKCSCTQVSKFCILHVSKRVSKRRATAPAGSFSWRKIRKEIKYLAK